MEHNLKTILKATLESPDSKLRLNVTSEIGKVKEELQHLNKKYGKIEGKTRITNATTKTIHTKDGTYIKIDVVLGV